MIISQKNCDIDFRHAASPGKVQQEAHVFTQASVIYREAKTRLCVGRAEQPRKEQTTRKSEKCVNGTESKAFFCDFDDPR